MARPIFKIASETPSAAPVGSIPTRSRHLVPRAAIVALVVLLMSVAGAPLAAQDSVAVAADSVSVAADSIATPEPDTTLRRAPSPTAALLKSLLIPGLGQISLGRKLTAAVFVAFEGATLGMVIKSQRDLNRLRLTDTSPDSALVVQKKKQREDWLVLMGVNHVASALEAYVSANLWDFPGELQIRAVPGGIGASASLPIRIR